MNERKYFQKYKYQKYIDGVAQSEYQTGDSRQTMISNLTDCQTGANVEWVDTQDTFIILNENGQYCKYLNPKRKKVDNVFTDIYMIEGNATPDECGSSLDDILVGRYDVDGDPDYLICDNYKLYKAKIIMAANGQIIGEYMGDYVAPCTAGCSKKEQTKTETSTYQDGIYVHTVTEVSYTKDCGNSWEIISRNNDITCIKRTDDIFIRKPEHSYPKTGLADSYLDVASPRMGDICGGFDEDGNYHCIITNTGDWYYEMYKIDMDSNTATYEGYVQTNADYPHGLYLGQTSWKINNAAKTATGIGYGHRFLTFDFVNHTWAYTNTDKTPASSDNYKQIYGFIYDWVHHGFVVAGLYSSSPRMGLFINDSGVSSGTDMAYFDTLGVRIVENGGYTTNNYGGSNTWWNQSDWTDSGAWWNGGEDTYGDGKMQIHSNPELEDGVTIQYSTATFSDTSNSNARSTIHVIPVNGCEANFARISINDCGTDGLYLYDGTNIRLLNCRYDWDNLRGATEPYMWHICCVKGTKACWVGQVHSGHITFYFY